MNPFSVHLIPLLRGISLGCWLVGQKSVYEQSGGRDAKDWLTEINTVNYSLLLSFWV